MSLSNTWRGRLLAVAVAVQAPLSIAGPQASPDAALADQRLLGLADSQARFCASHDPSGAEPVRARVERIERRVGAQAASALRGSPAYRSAFDAETAFLARVDDRNAPRVCEGRPARRNAG